MGLKMKNKLKYLPTVGTEKDMSELGYVLYYDVSAVWEEDGEHFSKSAIRVHENDYMPCTRPPHIVASGIEKYRGGIIPKQVHKDLASGKCKYLILDYSYEGYWDVDWEYISIITGVEESKLVWITSIWNPEYMNRQSEVTVCFTNFWENYISNITKQDYSPLERNMSKSPWSLGFEEQMKDINERRQRKYYALSYNRQARLDRAVLLTRLKRAGLLDKISYSWGLWSVNNIEGGAGSGKFKTAVVRGLLGEQAKDAWTEIVNSDEVLISDDEDLSTNMAFSINFNHIRDCYFQIVTETWVENSSDTDATPFLSEKSYKPFVSAMPFVTWGQKGTVEALRQQGYNVFDEWICHDYDKIADDGERLTMLMEEIERLCSIDHKDWTRLLFWMRHVFLHNYNNLYQRTRYLRHRSPATFESFDSTVKGVKGVDWTKTYDDTRDRDYFLRMKAIKQQ